MDKKIYSAPDMEVTVFDSADTTSVTTLSAANPVKKITGNDVKDAVPF